MLGLSRSRRQIIHSRQCMIVHTVYRVISSFTDAEQFRFIESVWKPDLLFEFPASKETSRPPESRESFDRTIADVKQTRMFSVMADETADISNKKNLLLTSAVSTLQRIFERSFLVSAIVENKQPATPSRR